MADKQKGAPEGMTFYYVIWALSVGLGMAVTSGVVWLVDGYVSDAARTTGAIGGALMGVRLVVMQAKGGGNA